MFKYLTSAQVLMRPELKRERDDQRAREDEEEEEVVLPTAPMVGAGVQVSRSHTVLGLHAINFFEEIN